MKIARSSQRLHFKGFVQLTALLLWILILSNLSLKSKSKSKHIIIIYYCIFPVYLLLYSDLANIAEVTTIKA